MDINDEDEEDDTSQSHDVDGDYASEGKAICFEQSLLELASVKVGSSCQRKNCNGQILITTKYYGSAVQLAWVRTF